MRRLWMFWLCSSLIGCRSSEHTETVEAFEDGAHVVASTPLAVELETLAVHAVTRTAEHDRMEAASGIYDVIGFFYPRPETSARSVRGLLTVHWDEELGSLEARFEGRVWGVDVEFVSTLAFDPRLDCYVETWTRPDGVVVRPLAQGFEEDEGVVALTRLEDGRPVRDELDFSDPERLQRRIWRTNPDGVEYLGLDLICTRRLE